MVHLVKTIVFPVFMYGCESWTIKKSWAPKNLCFWTVVLEKTLESPLDCKEIQPVHPKGNKSWIFFWRTDAEAETPILWPPDPKNWLIWKDLDAGKDWRQEEKGTTENGMIGWHHWLDGHEFEQAPGVDGQGSLVCCSPWICKQSDMTEQLNWQKIEIVKQKRYQLKQKELKAQCTSLVSILQVWVLRLIWGRILNWQGRVCLVFWVLFSWWYICSITVAYNHYLCKCIQCCVFKDK